MLNVGYRKDRNVFEEYRFPITAYIVRWEDFIESWIKNLGYKAEAKQRQKKDLEYFRHRHNTAQIVKETIKHGNIPSIEVYRQRKIFIG